MLLSVERPFAGAFAVRIPGAALLHRNGLVRAVLPASTEHGERTFGVPQEPGRSCRFLSEIPAGDTGITTPGLDGALVRRGAKRTSGRGGTAKRRCTARSQAPSAVMTARGHVSVGARSREGASGLGAPRLVVPGVARNRSWPSQAPKGILDPSVQRTTNWQRIYRLRPIPVCRGAASCRPHRSWPWVGAQVASPRCPILRPGASNVIWTAPGGHSLLVGRNDQLTSRRLI
jgi:hypothetical protein